MESNHQAPMRDYPEVSAIYATDRSKLLSKIDSQRASALTYFVCLKARDPGAPESLDADDRLWMLRMTNAGGTGSHGPVVYQAK